MSTSVLRIPVPAIKTLVAPTLKVLTAVRVRKDTLEMAQLAKVTLTMKLY